MFAYNNNVHFAINKTLNELFSKYVAIFDTKLKNKSLKKNIFNNKASKLTSKNKIALDKFVKKRC